MIDGDAMRKILLFVICSILIPCRCLSTTADEEVFLSELEELVFEEIEYDDVCWPFPVDLMDMDPELVVLANKNVLLDKDYLPSPLVEMKARKNNKDGSNANGGVYKASGGTMKLQAECADALLRLCAAAEADGYKLYLKSAYRSWQTQNTMYYNRLKKNNGKDDGWVSKPGASDHQTGLGCDVVPRSWKDKSMNEKMAKEPECQWMAEHCAEFGFILRYPEDKQDITEINYEPWHLRYVGDSAARFIMDNGLCLEEFTEQLQGAIQQFIADGGDPRLVEKFLIQNANDDN